jgi:sugar phosphate isomerase/epimerase
MSSTALSRRSLLSACAGVVAAAALPARKAAAATDTTTDPTADRPDPHALLPKERIGIQLYTVRDQVSSVGFAKVFERLSRIGYREVEFAGYTQGNVGPITPTEIRQLLDDNGLRAVGSHVGGLTQANASQQAEIANILGTPYIGIPSWQGGNTTTSVASTANNYNKIGEALAPFGVKFYFHNHNSEFAPLMDDLTKCGYLELVRQTDPRFVYFQMDILWAYVGQHMFAKFFPAGIDPIAIVTAARDRFPLFHVKDGERNQLSPQGYDMTDVGQGHIPFPQFFRTLNDATVPGEATAHHYLNENDNAAQKPHGSMGSAAASYGFMRHGLTDWTT